MIPHNASSWQNTDATDAFGDSGEQKPLGITNNTSRFARFNWELVHCRLGKKVKAIEIKLEMIRNVARRLGELREKVCYFGGATTVKN
jgi:hypothetical protein